MDINGHKEQLPFKQHDIIADITCYSYLANNTADFMPIHKSWVLKKFTFETQVGFYTYFGSTSNNTSLATCRLSNPTVQHYFVAVKSKIEEKALKIFLLGTWLWIIIWFNEPDVIFYGVNVSYLSMVRFSSVCNSVNYRLCCCTHDRSRRQNQ